MIILLVTLYLHFMCEEEWDDFSLGLQQQQHSTVAVCIDGMGGE